MDRLPPLPTPQMPTTMPTLPFDRARRFDPLPSVPNKPEAGSLIVIDSFQDTFAGADHGNTVAYTALNQGFRGKIYAQEHGTQVQRSSEMTMSLLKMPNLDPATTRKLLPEFASSFSTELLAQNAVDLEGLRKKGVHDSAVNISSGWNTASTAKALDKELRTSPEMLNNVAAAYNLDTAKITSNDPKVSGPERARLFQILIDAGDKGGHTPQVQAAKKLYDESVVRLESQHNSVVVSSGNEGDVLSHFTADGGGRKPRVKPDFTTNILASADTTTVGATRWLKNNRGQLSEHLAGYSSGNPKIDIYASGGIGTHEDRNFANEKGTSISAPAVAAAMARVHGSHPGMSSSQAQNLVRQSLTHQIQGPTGTLEVLDYQRTSQYLQSGTF